MVRRLDQAAEVAGHQLHAVADPEHRNPEIEDLRIDLEGALLEDARRPAREHQGDGVGGADSRGRQVTPLDGGLDPELTQPSSDQLGVLRAEIEDQNEFVAHRGSMCGVAAS